MFEHCIQCDADLFALHVFGNNICEWELSHNRLQKVQCQFMAFLLLLTFLYNMLGNIFD